MEYTDNENIQFDCSRGCTVTRDKTGELDVRYRSGCCKLKDYNWLAGVHQEQYKDYFEVRFKNTRKGIYFNASGQSIKTGDLVIVEAATGHDLGIVTLEGPIVGRQMSIKGIDPETTPLKKIYRKAKSFDIEKWQEALAREQETMIQARRIASEMGLEMKIGDVEFQGDGTKAIFYYIADGRVDFRQLIKVFAEEFRIRIEMKQIGARQEAGLIGGVGVCGRELCCANYISRFQSISTSAARCQDLSLNPQKLAGQCGKLKCCLNYEVANYLDAQSRIPRVLEPLEFEDGLAYLVKTDILREVMYFSYEKGSLTNIYPLDADEVREVIKMNRNGIKPESLKLEPEPSLPEFVTAVGDDSISRFDNPGKKKKKKNKNKNRQNNNQEAASNSAKENQPAKVESAGSQNDNQPKAPKQDRQPKAPKQDNQPKGPKQDNQQKNQNRPNGNGNHKNHHGDRNHGKNRNQNRPQTEGQPKEN